MKGVTILGSTGTIGVNTLDVMSLHPDQFRAVALTANNNVERLAEQCREWQPDYAVVADVEKVADLKDRLHKLALNTEVLGGVEGLERVSQLAEVDYVMAGIVGAAGLLPTLAAAQAGKRVLLANKEALVMSGALFMQAVHDHQAELLPIDSEHNALFQCMPNRFSSEGSVGALASQGISRILLTASGGPFRTFTTEQLSEVTPEQACAHPNWVMGRKISVDSATMMNKGLEIIEACWLFDTTPNDIEVVVHPQSIIHSMVAYSDGSVLAQMGNPDMRTPIAHAMAWPERIDSGVAALDFFSVGDLNFERPDETRFPCLRLAREACEQGGTATATLNAANEIAVEQFLERRIPFNAIPEVIEYALDQADHTQGIDLDEILSADAEARQLANTYIGGIQA
jgi:1-deoxy-D-xylulose-5-phosphate reductoisomerase